MNEIKNAIRFWNKGGVLVESGTKTFGLGIFKVRVRTLAITNAVEC